MIEMSERRRRQLRLAAAILAVITVGALIHFVILVEALRSQRATGPNWSFPSRVYSDGVAFVVGRTLPVEYLLAELEARDYRPAPVSSLVPGTYARTPDGFELVVRGLPDEVDPEGGGGPERVRLRIAGGRLIALERLGGVPGAPPRDSTHVPRLEPELVSIVFDEHRVWRTWVSLARVPVPVRDAIIASEDRRFYSHAGLDPRSALRALVANVKSGEVRQGGSTITQQLARALFLGRERTLARKLSEIPLAIGLDLLLSKSQVLEMYLNSVYWGQAGSFGIGGIGEAARWYFDAPVESLGVLEGATLAAMIPAPNEFDPFARPGLVLERRNRVLDDLVEVHHLAPAEAATLKTRPLDVRRGRPPLERFPSYSGYVADLIDRRISSRAATTHGLAIFTSMDLAWQIEAEAELAKGLGQMEAEGAHRGIEGAFVALEPTTSAVYAMVGGRSLETGEFNRAWQARRQTGSAIKPIVYAAAFAVGQDLTPATTVPDMPRTFGSGRWAWTPHNFDGSTHERVTLAKALEFSLNIATTNVVDMIGPGEVARAAARFGLGGMKAVPSIGLGSNETSLIDLTNAFAVFERDGMLRAVSPIRVVVDRRGRHVLEPKTESEQAIPRPVATLMTGLLENVVRYGVARPLQSTYGFNRPVAGKTGTTDDFHDAWFVAMTPDVVAGVWVGYDRPRNIGRQAAHTALPIWARIVGRMLAGFPPAPFTNDIELEWHDVEPWAGVLADSTCVAETMPFIPGTAPIQTCASSTPETYGEEGSIDSLYARDTSWTTEPDTVTRLRDANPRPRADTLEEAPDTLAYHRPH
ncbi:MAG TPA: transglycosylase domain-containing protein [Candidatus Udaeobacter sp.]|jgi:penicillin-binding protein 1B|nr:transglycosylase domain-containing protein [Candidatus Udaeobacter sp.]